MEDYVIDMDTKYVTVEGAVIDWQKKAAKGLYLPEWAGRALEEYMDLVEETGGVYAMVYAAYFPDRHVSLVQWRYV